MKRKFEIMNDLKMHKTSICVIGMGYVGLPLAVAFAEKFKVIGFDIDADKIANLKKAVDTTNEIAQQDLKKVSHNLNFTVQKGRIKNARIIIITVPTPINYHKIPDLSILKSASKTAGENLQKGAIIIYESTVYPGVTREICLPVLERASGLKWKKDFNIGYSPERINPGDKKHTIRNTIKIISGDTPETRQVLYRLYKEIVQTDIHEATSIEVAEAAKVMENTQRYLNIALINELAIICNKLNIDTREVLEAAGTKWNWANYFPGLVGGHCIGVDPYYLTFRAEELGYHPEVILAGRRINDSMGKYIADETVKLLIKADHSVNKSKILIMGITFKENISDTRNSRAIDIIKELQDYGAQTIVYDPYVNKQFIKREYNLELATPKDLSGFNAVIIAVAHDLFINMTIQDYNKLYKSSIKKVIIDIKGILDRKELVNNNYLYWRL